MTAVTRWTFVRHAPVTVKGVIYGASDVPADCSNSAAFRAVATALPSDAVWISSQLSRAKDTLSALAAVRGTRIEFEIDPRFAEQDFGTWEGASYAALQKTQAEVYAQFWQNPATAIPPGGESFKAVIDRVAVALDEGRHKYRGRDIVCVCHGGSIRAALAAALDLPPAVALKFVLDHLGRTQLDYIAAGAGYEGGWRVAAVNVPA